MSKKSAPRTAFGRPERIPSKPAPERKTPNAGDYSGEGIRKHIDSWRPTPKKGK